MKRLWMLVVLGALVMGCQDARKDEGTPEKMAEEKAEEPSVGGPSRAESGRHAPPTGDSATATSTSTAAAAAAKKEVRDARKILGEMAKWLPAETIAFMFADLGALDPEALGMGLFTIPTSFDPVPMTEELGAFLEKRVGINLMKVQWFASAGAPEPEFFVLLLGGDFGELAGAKDVPGGLKVRELDGQGFLATIPGVEGLAILPDEKSVETLSAVLQDEVPTLPGSPGLALLETLLERSGAPRGFVVVAQLTNEELRDKLAKELFASLKGFVPPDGALIGAGEDVLLLIHGQETSLEMIEGQITLAKAMGKALLDQGLAGIDQLDVGQGVGLIAAKHMWPVLEEQFTPKRDGEFMWLDLDIPGGLGMVSVVGVLSAVAIPAFLKYMRKAKTSEAHETLHKIYLGASEYYTETRVNPDGNTSTCQMPPSAGPVPSAGTCCGSFGGADTDGDDRCDGDEAEWDAAFGALGVPYPGPHYFTYELVPEPNSPSPAMRLRATGDLDCDGVRSTFERYVVGQPTPGGGCELEGDGRAMYVELETE